MKYTDVGSRIVASVVFGVLLVYLIAANAEIVFAVALFIAALFAVFFVIGWFAIWIEHYFINGNHK